MADAHALPQVALTASSDRPGKLIPSQRPAVQSSGYLSHHPLRHGIELPSPPQPFQSEQVWHSGLLWRATAARPHRSQVAVRPSAGLRLRRRLRAPTRTWWDNSRVTWTFRNRIELQPHSRLQYGKPEWIIDNSGPGKQVKLAGRQLPNNIPVVQILQEGIEPTLPRSPEVPIKDASILVLIGTGYSSEAEAMAEGELWRGRLMRAFAALNVAADFGDETRPSGGFTPDGLAAIGRGRRVLNDPLRLWAYEETDENPLFVASNPISEYWVSSPHERLEAALADAVTNGGLSQERQVSYSLYAASFGLAPESRFAMLMIAFESLLTLKPRSADVQDHVRSMMSATQNSALPANEIQSICGSLKWLLGQSINQAGRELARLLGPRDYLNGEAPDKFFTLINSSLGATKYGVGSFTATIRYLAPLSLASWQLR